MAVTADGAGYWIVTSDGGVDPFGDATSHGSLSGVPLAHPIVAMAATPSGAGYWLAASDGGVFALGDAHFEGSASGQQLAQPIVAITRTPSGNGYWLLAGDGRVFPFGDATSSGSLPSGSPMAIGMAATPDGGGYWILTSDGGVSPFGDATSHGSLSGVSLAHPIVAMAATPSGAGYWLVASDGGVFALGDAHFEGSASGQQLAQPIVAISRTPSGNGYWLIAGDGAVFPFGDAVAVPGRPVAPSALSATAGNGLVHLSWDAPGDNGGTPITGYDVYRSTAAAARGDAIATGVAATSYTDTSATNGTTFYYSVAASNANGEGALSAQMAATADGTPPAVFVASPATATQLAKVFTVRWGGSDAGSGLASYDVRYMKAAWNGKFAAAVTWKSATTATAGSFTGLAGYEYCFSVRGRDSAGNLSGWSAAKCTALPLDDRSLAASGGWSSITGKAFYNGTARQTSAKGKTLTRRGAIAGRAVLVIDEGKGFGSITIAYNGKVIKTASLAATRTLTKVTIALPKLTKATTIVIKTTSAKKVQIDGLLLARV